jgi:hypothetical protein
VIVYDAKNGFYADIRRDVVGHGSTPEEAQSNADQAEQARITMHPREEPPKPMRRFTLLTGELHEYLDTEILP